MLNIMFVCENRVLLKNVCSNFIDKDEYSIEIVSFSANAFEEFVEKKPEIVVIDSETLVPYKTIIKMFKKCNWEYYIIVLNSLDKIDFSDNQNVVYINKDKITKHKMDDVISNIASISDFSNKGKYLVSESSSIKRLTYIPDFYYIFFVKFFDNTKIIEFVDVEKLKNVLKSISLVEIIVENKNIAILVSKSKLNHGNDLDKLEKKITGFYKSGYTIFRSNNVSWYSLEEKYTQLLEQSNMSFFYKDQIVDVYEIEEKSKKNEIKDIDIEYENVLRAFFDENKAEMIRRIKEIYFRVIKPNLDIRAVLYLRQKLFVLNIIVNSMDKSSYEKLVFNEKTIEAEFNNTSMILEKLLNTISNKAMFPINKRALMYILNNHREEIGLDKLSAELGVTKVYLSRIFKEKMGINFLELIQAIRIFDAKFFLVNEKLKIAEVSKFVGYEDSRYFSRLFKRKTGLSPEKYRVLKRKEYI